MELAILEKKDLVTFFTKGDEVDAILKAIKDKALEFVPDVSTAKGRTAIKAQVTFVTKSKTYLEAKGKALAAEYKAIPKQIDANRKKSKEFLADLQAEVRLSLTEWEAEEGKKAALEAERAEAEKLQKELDECYDFAELMNDKFDRDAADKLAELAKIEKEAGLERARQAEIQAKEQELREQEIAKEAAHQAEQDRLLAEQREKAAIEAAEAAEARRVEQEIKAKADAKAAEANRITQAEDAKKAADKRAIEAAEAARVAEVTRQEIVKEQERKDQEKREANKKYIGGIRKEAKEDLIRLGLSEGEAKKVILAINSGDIRHLSIKY